MFGTAPLLVAIPQPVLTGAQPIHHVADDQDGPGDRSGTAGGRAGPLGASAMDSRTTWTCAGNPDVVTVKRGLKFAGSAPSSRQNRSTTASSTPLTRGTGASRRASSWLVNCTACPTVRPDPSWR